MARKRNTITDVPASGISWLSELVNELAVGFPPKDEGWATMSQICEQTGRDHQCMRRILKQRNAEVRKFKTIASDGKSFITPHYRFSK